MNQLFFGDNLHVLRDHLATESVDLIYLDPPFNSQSDYNLLFKSPKGHGSEAQITAFEDTWHWGKQAESEFDDILKGKNTDLAQMMRALRSFLGENDMMAYLTMMANRLLELHRVLKLTGSLYLHCDDTACHYLRLVMDGVFGPEFYGNQIVWRRTESHNDAKRYGRVTDVILFYTKTDSPTWNTPRGQHSEKQLSRYKQDATGKLYRGENLTAPGIRHGETGKPWRGRDPSINGNHWKRPPAVLEQMLQDGRILLTADGRPRLDGWKIYLDEAQPPACPNWWDDIPRIANTSAERLGYPTQKPLALLERIIAASSNEGDVVLDPFCGCGTAVHAAQKLNRQWIGIDITHLAISLIEKRLKDSFGAKCKFEVHGTPKDLDAARDLATRDKYQFQWWAVSLVEAQPFQGKKKGADGGIDGLKFFGDYVIEDKKKSKDDKTFKTCKIVVSVKSGGLKADDIRSLMAVREREAAEIALFISLEEPTRGMIADAASAGFYESATGKKFPRVQLLTIEGLLSGKKRAEHPDHQPDLNFKKAKAESNAAQKDLI